MKNAFAKPLILILLALLLGVFQAAAQTDCELASKTAPLLLNLQTGAAPETVQSVLGKSLKIKIKKTGERTFFQNYIKNLAPERLRGVRALYLRFFDRKLYQIEIFYEPRADLPPTREALVNALSAQFGLPAANWQTIDLRAEIKCGTMSLAADYVLNPRVELTDETVRAQIEAARAKDKKGFFE